MAASRIHRHNCIKDSDTLNSVFFPPWLPSAFLVFFGSLPACMNVLCVYVCVCLQSRSLPLQITKSFLSITVVGGCTVAGSASVHKCMNVKREFWLEKKKKNTARARSAKLFHRSKKYLMKALSSRSERAWLAVRCWRRRGGGGRRRRKDCRMKLSTGSS